MGNQLTPLEQCGREKPLRERSSAPEALTCSPSGCARTCGGDSRGAGGCAPVGTVFDETTSHLSEIDRLAFKFAGSSNLTALRWLFLYGARVHVFDTNGTTLLHVACRTGSLQVVQDLARRGLSVDVADRVGWTPLHVASCMGRQDLSLYLLQQGADAECKTEAGQTARDLCSDARTKDVVRGYDTTLRILPSKSVRALQDTELEGMPVSGGLHFEPFFVPRDPALREAIQLKEMQLVGVDIFSSSPGHGVAFLVAGGVVPDYPVNINRFLVEFGADAERYGDFLGSDFPVAQTLRLEFLNSLQLGGTGVVSALRTAFQSVALPRDWQKLDRLTRGVSHFWWLQHTEEEAFKQSEGVVGFRAGEGGATCNGGRHGHARSSGASSSSTAVPEPDSRELSGRRLQRCVGSAEGLHRLMFSTVMLHRWLRAGHQLTLDDWAQLNTSIDDGGSDVPRHVQIGIFDLVSEDRVGIGGKPSPRPTSSPSLPPLLEGWAKVQYRARAQVSYDGMPAVWVNQSLQVLAAQGGVTSAGRATLFASAETEACVEDADVGALPWRPPATSGGTSGQQDRTWLVAHPSIILLACAPDGPPYAFLSLCQSSYGQADAKTGKIALHGRPRSRRAAAVRGEGDNETWLELILLLSDGRFQLLEAPLLELRVAGADFDAWTDLLKMHCVSVTDICRI
mmetsp:Transcript_43082/g.125345  ORF Transcript_43082/g.125345 Transcript_43082/m.125345 type:complete len:681 (-) Transcript_43082:35-2077(-)